MVTRSIKHLSYIWKACKKLFSRRKQMVSRLKNPVCVEIISLYPEWRGALWPNTFSWRNTSKLYNRINEDKKRIFETEYINPVNRW